jgi:zinc transport system substrate-binding protein
MAELAPRITSALQQADPEGTAEYAELLRSLLAAIGVLQSEISDLLRHRTGSRFLVYHPAWASFAAEFSLQELAVEVEGKETTAKRLTELIDEHSEDGFDRLYTELGASQRGADALARELDLEIVPLDTLPSDWFAGLRTAAQSISKGLVP